MTDAAQDVSGVPDFGRDEAAIAAYEAAKQRYMRALTQDDEQKLRAQHTKRRDELVEEIDGLRDLAKKRQDMATHTLERYAAVCPGRVRKTGMRPPSLWERIRSFNGVYILYKKAAKAADELDDVNELLRKRREKLDALERDLRRQIDLREDAVKRKFQTPEGLAAMHADPAVKAAFARMQAAFEERQSFEERMLRGEVAPEEARDREMAQRGWRFTEKAPPGAMIAGVVRYPPLEYYVLRDHDGHEWLLSTALASGTMLTELIAQTATVYGRLEETVERLRSEALTDPLTGLTNRRGFDLALAQSIADGARHSRGSALLMIDIDHFKIYNDTFGHPAGDRALCAVAEIVRKHAKRARDVASRFGGEELALIMPEVTAAGAAAVGERIRAAVEAADMPQGRAAMHRCVTISVGVAATADASKVTPAGLLADADRALYQAKSNGRNCLVVSAAGVTAAPAE